MKWLSLLTALLLALCTACSDDSTPTDAAPPVEAGMEASVDAGIDAAPTLEMGLEAGAEASVDATPDDLSSE